MTETAESADVDDVVGGVLAADVVGGAVGGAAVRGAAVADVVGGAVAVRACAGWLALRREADVEARDRGAGWLLARLVEHLGPGATRVRVVDVGAGTGANRAYLEPRLHAPLTDRARALHGPPDDRARALHGPLGDRARALHAPLDDRARALHGPPDDRAHALHGPPDDRARALHGPLGDRARALHGPEAVLPQEWVAVDHDADLLAGAGHGDAVRVEAGVRDLPEVLAALGPTPRGTALLLTCAALLDVLDGAELESLAEAVERSGAPALLSLSVTGRVHWSPRDGRDGVLRRAFDGHQQRGGRPGPDAVSVLREDLAARGLTVLSARTPWILDARTPELLERWLEERVEAALEHAPQDAAALQAWSARRRGQLASGRLSVRVEHEDLLVLPS